MFTKVGTKPACRVQTLNHDVTQPTEVNLLVPSPTQMLYQCTTSLYAYFKLKLKKIKTKPKTAIPSADEDVKQLELSYILGMI